MQISTHHFPLVWIEQDGFKDIVIFTFISNYWLNRIDLIVSFERWSMALISP